MAYEAESKKDWMQFLSDTSLLWEHWNIARGAKTAEMPNILQVSCLRITSCLAVNSCCSQQKPQSGCKGAFCSAVRADTQKQSDSTAHISHLKLLILGKLLVTRLTERQRLNLKFIKSLNINKSNIAWAIASDVFDVNKYWFSLIKHKMLSAYCLQAFWLF